mmetsp:Transcript_2314/g.5315  ORF Transcript_2314/g.5315 Transcript_2314/m.5315 type:complete len:165 (+) Transcript_2314:354-848(+)
MQSISEPEAKRAPGTINQPANQPVMRSENTKTKTSNRSRPRETNFEPIHRGSKGIAAPGSDFWNRRLLDKPDANQPTNKSEQANEFIRGDPPKTSDHSVLLSSTITPASQPLDLWMRCGAKSTEKKNSTALRIRQAKGRSPETLVFANNQSVVVEIVVPLETTR